VKLIGAGIPKDKTAVPIQIEKETKLSALIHGGRNHGMLVLKKAVELAISKAKAHSVGIVGTHHTSTSTGCLSYYANQIAKQGLIGLIFSTSPPSCAPFNSFERIFGTNPISIGIPSSEGPIILDMATSAMAFYGVVEAKTEGKQLPPNVAYDAQGNPTTDPNKVLAGGALRSFDRNYKGSGLALMVQILAGPFVKAAFAGNGDTAGNWGNLVIAVDPSLLVDSQSFQQEVNQLVQRVKSAKSLPGTEVFLPGEHGNIQMKRALSVGYLDIEENLYQQLLKVGSTISSKL